MDNWKVKAEEKRKEVDALEEATAKAGARRNLLIDTLVMLDTLLGAPKLALKGIQKGIQALWLIQWRCSICGKPATMPHEERNIAADLDQMTGSDGTGRVASGGWSKPETDWTRPGDLERCRSCGEWACSKHIHAGICQRCAERL